MSVESAQEATEIGMSFLKKTYAYAWPKKAVKKQNRWYVDIDVGLFKEKVVKLIIDSVSGKIIEYDVPT